MAHALAGAGVGVELQKRARLSFNLSFYPTLVVGLDVGELLNYIKDPSVYLSFHHVFYDPPPPNVDFSNTYSNWVFISTTYRHAPINPSYTIICI
jgi:hypothetical protein